MYSSEPPEVEVLGEYRPPPATEICKRETMTLFSNLTLNCQSKSNSCSGDSLSLSEVTSDRDARKISESIYNLSPIRSRVTLEPKVSDVEIQYLDELEKQHQDQVDQLNRNVLGETMSDSEYVRRRDELNRRLMQDEQELNEIIEERDQALKDKQKVESAISDVQEKYERVLKTVLSLKEKEQLLIERDNENVMKVEQMDKELEEYKEKARKQVESEYQNWLSKLAEAEATNVRLKAMMRKADMKVEKMEHTLGQRSKENNELHNLCDDLINNSSRKNSVQD